jgi:hypothetical protein
MGQQTNKLSLSLKHPRQGRYIKETQIKPLSYYEEDILKRNIFKKDLAESKVTKIIPQGLTFKELVKDLYLRGIIFSNKPQVIIEDTKIGKTYFLYGGDYLGEIRIEEIYPDKAILEFKGERINMSL